ncbi:alkaline phosphatase synthesis sensor protein PhoR [Andreesenia angusta]|uniref:histidine kinase n=2 Tax=Andreesenia angusta TaxID=39480 RepID=A0A1S1V7X9_9FIRM|nr:alkaline phosphatase synthesis sensor protein PhoR [Andreesenia angusta]
MYLSMLVILLIFMNIAISGIVRENYIKERRETFDLRLESIAGSLRYYMATGEIDKYRDQINSILTLYGRDSDSDIFLLDRDNIIVGSSNGMSIGNTKDDYIVKRAFLGESEFEINTLDQEIMNIAYPIMSARDVIGVVYVVSSIGDIYDSINYLDKGLVIVSLVGIAIMAIVKFGFTGYVLRPLDSFSEAILRISEGDLDYKIEINTNDEFNDLAETFNSMTHKLKEADSHRKDFIAYVSHELKTPLSTIKLLSETMVHDENMNIDICKEFMEDISSESDRLTNIVNDLLTLMELEITEMKIDFEMANLKAIAEKVHSNMTHLAAEKDIDFRLSVAEELEFKFDPDRIKQTLINIISNAIKYTDRGGTVELKLYSEYDSVVVEISDNGIGIPEESLPHIFDRFYRVDKARARATGGSGLGLSIANQIVSLHGGKIEVESKLGEGTTIKIRLPYVV